MFGSAFLTYMTVSLCPSCKTVLRRTRSPHQNSGSCFSHCNMIFAPWSVWVFCCAQFCGQFSCLAQGQMQPLHVEGRCPGALTSPPWLTQDRRVRLWSSTYLLDAMQSQASSSPAEILEGSQTAQQLVGTGDNGELHSPLTPSKSMVLTRLVWFM